MKRFAIGIILVCIYGFPYAFFSMYQDYTKRSMVGYGFMIIMSLLLGFCARFSNRSAVLIAGNLLSFAVSYHYTKTLIGTGEGYFKPLSPDTLLLIVSILNLVPQVIGLRLSRNHTKA